MFRHKEFENKPVEAEKKENLESTKSALPNGEEKIESQTIKELLEKNLKWSQIIYEQNRKINNKLMWSTVAGWVRVFLILLPLLAAAWFLPDLIEKFQNIYNDLMLIDTNSVGTPNSFDKLMQIIPLDPAKQEQLKALLK